jgi:protein-L-isoaspartate O-methyltransferase
VTQERSQWFEVTAHMDGAAPVRLGPRTLAWQAEAPHRLIEHLTHHKIAAKMIGRGRRVLVGDCGEGLGAWVLARECGRVTGVDQDNDNVQLAQANWGGPDATFLCGDWRSLKTDAHDALVWLAPPDAPKITALDPAVAAAAHRLLTPTGVMVVGTPVAAGATMAVLREHFEFLFPFATNGLAFRAGSATHEYALWLASKPR